MQRVCDEAEWQTFLDCAAHFKLTGLRSAISYVHEQQPRLDELLPGFGRQAQEQILLAMHSYFLSDFTWYTTRFQRQREDFDELAAIALKRNLRSWRSTVRIS